MKKLKWNLNEDIKVYWEDCEISISCPYCTTPIEISSKAITECDCGHRFYLTVNLYEELK